MIDATTLGEIWQQHADRLLLVARSIGGPAEDAVQEAFLALARQPHPPDDPMAWLVRVTRNRLLQWQRSGKRRRQREASVSGENWFEHQLLPVEQRLDAHEVTEFLRTLPSPRREIIVMRLWGEMTFDAIAEVVELSRASAHRQYTQGLEQMKQRFERSSDRDSMRLCNEP